MRGQALQHHRGGGFGGDCSGDFDHVILIGDDLLGIRTRHAFPRHAVAFGQTRDGRAHGVHSARAFQTQREGQVQGIEARAVIGVDEVDARGFDGNANLSIARLWRANILKTQHLCTAVLRYANGFHKTLLCDEREGKSAFSRPLSIWTLRGLGNRGIKKEMERAKRRLTALDNRKQELKTMAQMDEKLQVRSRLLKTQLTQMRIRASVSGVALTHDLELAALDGWQARVMVQEVDIPKVKAGQKVRVYVNAFPQYFSSIRRRIVLPRDVV